MTTDFQRQIIAARLTGLYGEGFTVDTYKDEVTVSYPITENGRTRYVSGVAYRNLDGRKRVTEKDCQIIAGQINGKIMSGSRDPRFTDQARNDYKMVLDKLPSLRVVYS